MALLAKSDSQVNKLKTGPPQPNASFSLLTCWYSWQTSGWASVFEICSRCGLRRGLEQPPSTAASTMRGAQGWEEEEGDVTWSSSSLRKTTGGTKVPNSLAAARHWMWIQRERGREWRKTQRHEGVLKDNENNRKSLFQSATHQRSTESSYANRCIPSPWALLGPFYIEDSH